MRKEIKGIENLSRKLRQFVIDIEGVGYEEMKIIEVATKRSDYIEFSVQTSDK